MTTTKKKHPISEVNRSLSAGVLLGLLAATSFQLTAHAEEAPPSPVQVEEVTNEEGTETPVEPVTENVLEQIEEKQTPIQFIRSITGEAKSVAEAQGLYASVMIAQASLESGYGASSLSLSPNHNLFGIKGTYDGQFVAKYTDEYTNGKWIRLIQNFKKYPSYQASFEDNARLLRNGLSWNRAFYSGAWMEKTTSYRDATQWLQGRYATDPAYASKLNHIIETFNLTQYDSNANNQEVEPSSSKPAIIPNTSATVESSQHTIKRGDTLSRIARTYKTTVAKLKADNNLKSDLIFVGQRLVLNAQNVAETPAPAPKPVVKPVEKTIETKPVQTVQTSYTIKSGDTLSRIARTHKTTVAQLKAVNNLKSDLIYVGRRLVIPGTQASQPAKVVTAPKPVVAKPVAPKPVVAKPVVKTQHVSTSVSVTVKRGDTLSKLARDHKTTVAKLKSENNLKSDMIRIGQRLVVSGSKAEQVVRPAVSTAKPTTQTVKVKRGDTLSGLSRRYKTSVSRIKQLNNLKSDLIFVNQTLKVS